MKTILTRLLALSGIALLMFTGCKKTDVVVTSNGGKAGTLTASSTTPALTKARITDTTKIVNFTFTQANYGYSGAAVTNTLQIDKAGDNWANPTSVTLSAKVLAQGYNTLDFDNLLLKLGLVGGTSTTVNVRVAQAISTTLTPAYSNVVTLTVTPFNLTSWLYITGDFSGWVNPGAAEDSLLSATSNGIYTGIINFPAQSGGGTGQFLILPAKNWNNKYATSQSSTPTTTVTYNANNNIIPPQTPGYYLITFNVNTGAITFSPADYYSIIGSAPPGSAWNTDNPMKYINDGSGTWIAKSITMVVGEYKFRQDNQWTNSWGPSATAGMVTSSGATGDGNIQLTAAGIYNISFVMPASPYGTAPLGATSYSAIKTN